MSDENNSLDILGVKPIAESINKVTEGTVDGASAFLSRICLPAAEEFGLLLRDKVSSWRAKNTIKILKSAQSILEQQVGEVVLHAHPRIIYSSIENGSWCEDDFMQNFWSGLIISSCTESGKDESNLILIHLLSQMTSSQAKLIGYICQNCDTYKSEAGWINSLPFYMELAELNDIMKVSDFYQVDRELDHLKSLGLIEGGFEFNHTRADVTPKALCLNLYTRCQGYIGNPCDFFQSPEMSENQLHEAFVIMSK